MIVLHATMRYVPWINSIGSVTLDVYLMQSSPVISSMILWSFFEEKALYMRGIFPILVLVIPLCVFLVGILLGLLRKWLLGHIKLRFLEPVLKRIDAVMDL